MAAAESGEGGITESRTRFFQMSRNEILLCILTAAENESLFINLRVIGITSGLISSEAVLTFLLLFSKLFLEEVVFVTFPIRALNSVLFTR